MSVEQGPVITGVLCQICEQWAAPDEIDVIHGVVAHASCLPSHWIESRDNAEKMMERLA